MAALPVRVIRQLCKEVSGLMAHPLDGISAHPNDANISVLEAEVVGPEDTPFQDGVFTLRLVFPAEYPASPPKGFFLTKIFHPNISDRGDICVNALKKDWSPDLGIRHVLLVIRCLLIQPNPGERTQRGGGSIASREL